ncbi:MAG: hypothetical protein U0T81_01205 [Saprospiraceae bacterium]
MGISWIPTGEDFDLAIKDANDCSTDLFTGSHICNCITDAGFLDTTNSSICVVTVRLRRNIP